MEMLIMLFPMLIDQIKAMGQDEATFKPAMASHITIHNGMTLAKVLSQTGMPESFDDVVGTFKPTKMLSFKGPLCTDYRQKSKESCYIVISEGKVIMLTHIHPKHMGLM